MAALPRRYRRDFTSVLMNIKEFNKPIQNAHVSPAERGPTVYNGMWEWLPATNIVLRL
jgi:hypothetical protein